MKIRSLIPCLAILAVGGKLSAASPVIDEQVAAVITQSKSMTTSDPQTAIGLMDSLLAHAALNARELMEVHYTKGRVYYIGLLQKDQAILSFYQALRHGRSTTDFKRQHTILSFLGLSYKDLNHYEYAQEYYVEALKIQLPEVKHGLVTLYNLGRTLRLNEQYDSAARIHRQLVQSFEKEGMDQYVTWSQLELGASYIGNEDWERALEIYDALEEKARLNEDQTLKAKSLHSLGTIYLGMGQLEKAREYLQLALPLKLSEGDQQLLLTTYNNMGILEERVGNKVQAREYLKKSAELDPRQVDVVMQIANIEGVIEISEELGDMDIAYEYSQRLNEIMIPLVELNETLEKLHTRYLAEKIRSEIEAFELKESLTIAQMRIWWIASVLTLLLVIGGLVYGILKKRQRLDDSVIEHLKLRDQLLYYISYRYHVDVPSMMREMQGDEKFIG